MNNLMKVIGYKFKQPRLLEIALTHRSRDVENNERLEFLGDAALGFIVADQLFGQFPFIQEGELSRLRAYLVNEDSLVELAHHFEIGEHLRLGYGELRSGGIRRKSILADAIEAIIGAIYLDADFLTCKNVVLKWFEHKLPTLGKLEAMKDPKSLLQEYLQSHKWALPHYTTLSVTGETNMQQFHVICEVEHIDYRAEGLGDSRRAAEQMAADVFLKWLKKEAKK